MFAFLSSSKLKENLTELHIIVRTTGFIINLLPEKGLDSKHYGMAMIDNADDGSV